MSSPDFVKNQGQYAFNLEEVEESPEPRQLSP
jgi:hypothetical protein